ncbi:disease resistance protein RPV1-like [Gastrolobium bilobum]|uniref:disease resistance protein RPV1-like n=1 Tax=Gastrolobium bilobum TaxID=150636 RepID=UPI002AB2D50F|nr:disease resistance protein RPV1-like [Gastrolobium bilobum]
MTNEGAIATPYDVFLSYSNDTRLSFTANLYHTLRDKGIKTFPVDDDDDDEDDSDELLRRVKALEESRVSIVVLSKDYAYSMRCLDELVKIIDCKKRMGQQVWPIFYGVDPSDVRYERGSYGQAMVAHEDMINKDYMKVQEWRTSLSEVANLTGWQLKIGSRNEENSSKRRKDYRENNRRNDDSRG